MQYRLQDTRRLHAYEKGALDAPKVRRPLLVTHNRPVSIPFVPLCTPHNFACFDDCIVEETKAAEFEVALAY